MFCTVSLGCQPTPVNIQPTQTPSVAPSSVPQTSDALPLPEVAIAKTPRPNPAFRSIFPALKYQTKIPVFLPGDIPGAESAQPLYAILEASTTNNYQILLAFTENCGGGNACRLGSVSGNALSERTPLAGQPVMLTNGVTGYFVEATCRANCSDATLSWERDGDLYTVGLKAGDRAALIKMANSAIANGAL
jgi:hypothetical protein